MLHWLYVQMVLTGHELRVALSIPHIVTGFVVYGIIHHAHKITQKFEKRAANTARQMSKTAKRAARRQRNGVIDHHVKTGHEGRYDTCERSVCSSLQNLAQQYPVPLESQQLAELLEES